MKMALVTTTVHVPEVLRLYREYTSAPFFVAADNNTPAAAFEFCNRIDNCFYISAHDQVKLPWKTLRQLPWNTITRRNVAVLEALRWGAEIIVTIDDDNIPLHSDYFLQFEAALANSFYGLSVEAADDWFDPGALLTPPAPHRGFPYHKKAPFRVAPVTGVRVGVAAGMCLGDPDIGAAERYVNAPVVHGASCLLQAGVTFDPMLGWTVFNTQNTAYLREMAPAMLLCPQLGRYDDIFASLITQCVMADHGQHVRFGQPFVWQARNLHNIVKDLRAELYGMEHVVRVAERLQELDVLDEEEPVSVMVRRIYTMLAAYNDWPGGTLDLANAWCEDCEGLGL